MSTPTVPIDAVGHVGLVAMLKLVNPESEGKLVLVRKPAGWVTSLIGSSKPVFAWQVLSLGEALQVHGRHSREIYVADACLIPVSEVPPGDVDALAKAAAHQDFDEALADLGKILKTTSMSSAELEGFVDRAANQFAIERALETVPTPIALQELGFKLTQADGESMHWTGIHEGAELRIHAGLDMFEAWSLLGVCVGGREAMCDQRFLPPEAPRGAIACEVLKLWRTAFGRSVVPDCLELGRVFEQHQASMRRLELRTPTLQVDGQVFRRTVRWLRDRHIHQDETQALRLSFHDGLFRLAIHDTVYGCPARGEWAGDLSIDAAALAALPRGSLGVARHIAIQQKFGELRIGWLPIVICGQ